MTKMTPLASAAALMLLLNVDTAAADEAAAAGMAAALPPAILEVANGGAWSKGDDRGYYRAIVVSQPDSGKDVSFLYLQWITYKGSTSDGTIIAAVPVKEVNALKLPNAFLAIDAEKEQEALVTVSSFDPEKDADIIYTVTATAPGSYTVAEGSSEQ